MKHTKGEWKFNGRDIVVGQHIGQQRICTLIEHREEYKIEDEANAKLIAAAPDLLTACKYALDAVEDSELYPQDATDKLAAAIAKTE